MRATPQMPVSYLLPDWMRCPTVPLLFGNELRAISSVFFSALLVLALSAFMPEIVRLPLALAAYGFGCAAISAAAFGHDFTHRTLLMTFGQPISREELWKTRMKAALLSCVPLALIAAGPLGIAEGLVASAFQGGHILGFLLLLFVPILSGLCIAPWFTLICRSVLAGTVFSFCLPVILLFAAEWLVVTLNQASGRRNGWELFQVAFGIVCAFAFFDTRARWLRLEAAEPVRASLGELALFTKVRPQRLKARRGSPLLELCWKELKLQWIIAVPILGTLIIAAMIRGSSVIINPETQVYATFFFAAAVCVIIGAVGSAEERQLGVSESQALLPVSKSAQWCVKIGVLFVLTQLSAVNLPQWMLEPRPPKVEMLIPASRWWSIGAFFLVALSLYISSCCRTTMKAVLASLPLAPLVLALFAAVQSGEAYLIRQGIVSNYAFLSYFALLAPYLCGLLLIFLLIRYAAVNHFSAETAPGGQMIRLTAVFIGMVVFYGSLLISVIN